MSRGARVKCTQSQMKSITVTYHLSILMVDTYQHRHLQLLGLLHCCSHQHAAAQMSFPLAVSNLDHVLYIFKATHRNTHTHKHTHIWHGCLNLIKHLALEKKTQVVYEHAWFSAHIICHDYRKDFTGINSSPSSN